MAKKQMNIAQKTARTVFERNDDSGSDSGNCIVCG